MTSFIKRHIEALSIIFVVLIAVFFRFYRLSAFQYWSSDDEIFSAVVTRMIFGHKITLVSPNATLGVSLGSFFHVLSIAPYLISHLNASGILTFGSVLGVITTLLLYFTGKEIGGRRVGFLASFLYATSFLVSFTDRRWWPLTPDALLATLAIFSLVKMLKRKLFWSLPLAIAASFAWHSDPTLLVVSLAALISLIVFRLPIFSRAYIPALIYLIISVTPFLIFELRHPAAITYPINHFITNRHNSSPKSGLNGVFSNDIAGNFTRSIFLSPSTEIENYLLYCKFCKEPPLALLARIIAVVFLVLPLFVWRKNPSVKPIYAYLASFIIGISIFSFVFGTPIYLHFYVVVWPAFFLLTAISLDILFRKKLSIIVCAFVILVFAGNMNVITSSKMKYPLNDRIAAASFIVSKVGNRPFSLVINTSHPPIDGIGGLLYLKNTYPANASYYDAWDWIYMAYSLYGTKVDKTAPAKTVLISPKSSAPSLKDKVSANFGEINVSITP